MKKNIGIETIKNPKRFFEMLINANKLTQLNN